MSATENAIALGVLFSVNSTNILLGDTVQLNATIIDPSTNMPYTTNNVNVSFTKVNSNNASTLLGYNHTTAGIALWNTQYPGSACAYKAEIVPTYNGTELLQGLVSSPVQLTVGDPTTLQMTVTGPDDSSFEHVINGSLWDTNGAPVSSKIVTVEITSWISNQVFSETTDSNGKFSFACNLNYYVLWGPPPPGTNNYYSGEYTLEANFTGDTASSAVACSSLLGGTSCTSCATVQYGTSQSGYEPSSGSNILSVSQSKTTGTGVVQTSEQLQQDAKNSGWFSVYNEFNWWYPWYRLHYVLNAPIQPYGIVYADLGFSVLPFGTSFKGNATVLANILIDAGKGIGEAVIGGYICAYVAQHIASELAGRTLVGIVAAVAMYGVLTAITECMLAAFDYSRTSCLAAFIGNAFACFLTYMVKLLNNAVGFANALLRTVTGEVTNTLNSMWGSSLDFFNITDFVFYPIDFALMILYLGMAIKAA